MLAYGVPPARGTADAPITADTPPAPAASRYAASKAAGDAAVARIAADGGPDACTCYLACCIGRDPKLLDAEKDVMRIAPLISGQASRRLIYIMTSQSIYVNYHALDVLSNAQIKRVTWISFQLPDVKGSTLRLSFNVTCSRIVKAGYQLHRLF